jgi:hypothetical protein
MNADPQVMETLGGLRNIEQLFIRTIHKVDYLIEKRINIL